MVEIPQLAYLQLRERDLVLPAVGRKALRPLGAVLRALLLTSMLRTNLVSLWSTARPPLYAGVVGISEADHKAGVLQHITAVVRDQAVLVEEASNRGVEVNEVQGGGGEIGTRCPNCISLWFTVVDPCSTSTGRSCSRVLCCN